MKVKDAMTRDVSIASPEDTLQQAASKMAALDAGVLPVGANDRLVGMLTDRDITVRAVAQGKGPQTAVRDVMSEEVKYCFEDEDLAAVTANMGDIRVRRLPVLNREKRLVGIVSLGDIVNTGRNARHAGQALAGISQPGGEHSQTPRRADRRPRAASTPLEHLIPGRQHGAREMPAARIGNAMQ